MKLINYDSGSHSVRTTEALFSESDLYNKKSGFLSLHIDYIENGLNYIDQVLSILTIEIKRMGKIEVKND